jgi:drug/metabolite transporter (DMT)-like permease
MRRGYLALFTLAMIWGAAFLFIKLAVRDMSPGTLVLARAVFGAVTLGVIFAVRRQTPFPTGTRARLLPFLVMAIVGSLIPRGRHRLR